LVATYQVNKVAALENWDNPSGLRFGSMDVTRPGIFKDRLGNIAEDADKVDPEVYYCFDNGYSPKGR